MFFKTTKEQRTGTGNKLQHHGSTTNELRIVAFEADKALNVSAEKALIEKKLTVILADNQHSGITLEKIKEIEVITIHAANRSFLKEFTKAYLSIRRPFEEFIHALNNKLAPIFYVNGSIEYGEDDNQWIFEEALSYISQTRNVIQAVLGHFQEKQSIEPLQQFEDQQKRLLNFFSSRVLNLLEIIEKNCRSAQNMDAEKNPKITIPLASIKKNTDQIGLMIQAIIKKSYKIP